MRSVILCIDDEAQSIASLLEQWRPIQFENHEIKWTQNSTEVLDLIKILSIENVELPLILMGPQETGRGIALLAEIHRYFLHTQALILTEQRPTQESITVPSWHCHYIAKPWNKTDVQLVLKQALYDYEQQRSRHGLATTALTTRNSNALLQATLDATVDGILALDCDGQITHFNQALLDLFAPTSERVVNQAGSHRSHANGSWHRDRKQTIPLLTQWLQSSPELWEYLMAHRCPQTPSHSLAETQKYILAEAKGGATTGQGSASTKPLQVHSITLANGRSLEYQSQLQRVGQQIVGQVWSFHDVTERQRSEALIRYQAHHDFLTGIANRFKFNDVLDSMLNQAALDHSQLAVLFIDLDRFKVINDSLGHNIGDELLKSLVQRLQRICRPGELIARWGGDEFTMVVGNLSQPDGATEAARRILLALHRPFEIQGHQLRVNVSIGIAQYPQDGTSAEQLLKRADMALYQVKEEGRNGYQHYTPKLDQAGQALFAIESALHQALERNELSLHYQPQLDSTTGQVTHIEALLRWHHPTLGSIPPQEFIAVAEQNGLICSLGEWVLTEACHQAKRWQQMGLPPVIMCVNLSPLQLSQTDLPKMIQQVLTTTQLDPQWLELEITESAALRNAHVIKDVLDSLRKLGLGLALDDFGTGYSSLSYAKQLPFDTLKLDQSFVRDLMTNHSDGVIVQAVLAIGKGLQRRVVAEGVETKELQNLLQSWDCRYIQGYWFSRPLAAEAATEFLQTQQMSVIQAA